MFPPLKYGEEGAENEVRLTSRGLQITHMLPPLELNNGETELAITSKGIRYTTTAAPRKNSFGMPYPPNPSQTMFFGLPPLSCGPEDNRTYIQYTSKGAVISHQENGETITTTHEYPAPLVAGVTAVAAVAAVGALATVGVPTAIAAGAVAATTAAATSGSDDLVPVEGYYRDDGTYVRGHNRTHPDGWEGNNFTS